MPYIKKLNFPGSFDKLKYSFKGSSDSIESEIISFIKRYVLFDYTSNNSGPWKEIYNFDTSYLEKASIDGSEENEFFKSHIVPVLDSLDKNTNPKDILNFIEGEKQNQVRHKNISTEIFNRKLSPFMLTPHSGKTTKEEISKDLGSIRSIVDYLESQGSVYNNFSGAQSIAGAKRSDISDAVKSIESLIADERDNPEIVTDLRKGVDAIVSSHAGQNQKNVFPFALTVKGLKDFEGDDIPEFQYYFPIGIPISEDYINTERTANLEFEDGSETSIILNTNANQGAYNVGKYYKDKGVKKKIIASDVEEVVDIEEQGFLDNFIKDYLKSYKISDYVNFNTTTNTNSEDKDLTEFSLILQLIEAQREQGINVRTDAKPLLDFRDNYLKNIPKYNRILQDINKKTTDKFSRLSSLSNKTFPTLDSYLKQLIDQYDNRERKPRGNKSFLPIQIPYKYFEGKSNFKKDKNPKALGEIYNIFEKSWNSKNPKNPISGRDTISLYTSFFNNEEANDALYLDGRLYDIIESGNADALKNYYSYNNIQDLKNEEFTLEHITPVNYLNKILWDQIYVPMKEQNKSDEEIKEAIEYTIKTLYKEALILTSEDNAKLKGGYQKTSPLTSSDFESLRNRNADEDLAFKRYDKTSVPRPKEMSIWKENFPKDMKNITYGQIYKPLAESKKSITNLLFGHYG